MEVGSRHFDWSRPVEPPRMNRWIADHRVRVRAVFILVDAVMGGGVVWAFTEAGLPWFTYLTILSWVGLTLQFGWLIPAGVDRWRATSCADPERYLGSDVTTPD